MSIPGFDVCVIGGGVLGTAVAYWLRRLGRSVVLVERASAGGAGATQYSGGILRGYDPDPLLSEWSVIGSSLFSRWEELRLPGASPVWRAGALYRVAPAAAAAAAARADALSRKEYPIHCLDARAASLRFPFLASEHPGLTLHEARGGYADPRSTARQLGLGLERAGGALLENCGVRTLERRGPAGIRVRLDFGELSAERVVVAAGAWSHRLLPELPLVTRTIPLAQLSSPDLRVELPVIDEVCGTYVRPQYGAMFYAGSHAQRELVAPERAPAFGSEESEDALARVRRLLRSQVSLVLQNGMQGFDAYTRDLRPLAGFTDARQDVFVLTGMSGRGFKLALALGYAAARALAGASRSDAGAWSEVPPLPQAFSPTRFDSLGAHT